MEKEPSGAKMAERTRKVKDQVKSILEEFPSTRGNDTLLIYRLLRRFYPHIKITFTTFEQLFYIPAFETMRRRRQELQAEFPELRPTERTMRKRLRREKAFHNMFGRGLTLEDYIGD